MNFIKTLTFIIIFSLTLAAVAQKKVQLKVNTIDKQRMVVAEISSAIEFSTTEEALKEIQTIYLKLLQKGFLAASVDSIITDSSSVAVWFFVGKQYQWAYLSKGNVEEYALSKVGFRDKIYNGNSFNIKQINRLLEQLIIYYENNGNPFASIRLDSIEIIDNRIKATLNLEKNKFIAIDSVVIVGTGKITPKYLYNYLDIKPQSDYNEERIRAISVRLKEIPFLKEERPFNLLFTDDYTKLTLFLADKKASKFDGIIGLLPDDKTGKVNFTGDVKLLLINALGKGESIRMNWRKLQTNTTDLKINLTYPFLLNSPIGIESQFLLYRRDTSFQDVQFVAGLRYLLPRGNYFKVYYDQKQSRLLNTGSMGEITVLPSEIDVNNTTYGIGLKSTKLDYKYNPTKGHDFNIIIGVGTKQILKNADLPAVIYDDIELKTIQYNGLVSLDFYIPVFKQTTIKLGMKSAYRQNQTLFFNELYRLGGLRTIRGFDEESLNASSYSIGTFEFRYLLEQNSYAYVFFDGAYYEDRRKDTFSSDTPFGFGLGVSFETGAGIFSLNYALGYQQGELAPIRSAKIHFGFVNYF